MSGEQNQIQCPQCSGKNVHLKEAFFDFCGTGEDDYVGCKDCGAEWFTNIKGVPTNGEQSQS